MSDSAVRYSVSGAVASERIAPLVPSEWIDTTESSEVVPDFLWENAPRRESKDYRDEVRVYSHLPNGTTLLDSKWALGRLFAAADAQKDPLLASLETHCFRGLEGFQAFAHKMKLLGATTPDDDVQLTAGEYPDILDKDMDLSLAPDPAKGPSNLWVVSRLRHEYQPCPALLKIMCSLFDWSSFQGERCQCKWCRGYMGGRTRNCGISCFERINSSVS